jgi:hypothetical protein
MKVTIDQAKKRKRCYTCSKLFDAYNLVIPQEEVRLSEGKLVGIKLAIFSLKGNRVELCPACKIQKFISLGATLTKAKYRINKNYIVRMETESLVATPGVIRSKTYKK